MARALSALLLPLSVGTAAEVPLRATGFTHYPGYAGGVTMAGRLSVGRTEIGNLVLFYDFELMGTGPLCDVEETPTEADGCGIRIHTGRSCDSVEANYYSSVIPEDPWLHVTYSTVGGKATGRNVHVHTGITLADLTNRTVVVHDGNGVRLACAPLTPFNVTGLGLVPTFSKYPDYKGSLVVQGTVEIAQETYEGVVAGSAQALRFQLTGVDRNCVATADLTGVKNACGIHIHAGKSCADTLLVGPDLYDSTNIFADPWAAIQYVGVGQVATGVTTPVVTGASISNVIGKALVVYDFDGQPVACAVIQPNRTGFDTGAAPIGVASLAGSGPSPRWWALALAAALARAAL